MSPLVPLSILLVEDDLMDVLAFKRELRNTAPEVPLRVASSGAEALEVLRGSHGRPPMRPTTIVVLDLGLPGMSGLAFLETLRQDPIHKDAPVFVLTASDKEMDKAASFSHDIAGFLYKGNDGAIREVVQLLTSYLAILSLGVD